MTAIESMSRALYEATNGGPFEVTLEFVMAKFVETYVPQSQRAMAGRELRLIVSAAHAEGAHLGVRDALGRVRERLREPVD